jgi:hypothetical protein
MVFCAKILVYHDLTSGLDAANVVVKFFALPVRSFFTVYVYHAKNK